MDPVRLGTLGQIYVPSSTASTYALAVGRHHEDARRELTELAIDAREKEPITADRLGLFRLRSQALRLDLSLRVARDGPLLVIVAVSVRRHDRRG